MSQLLTVNLSKSPNASWGFRLQGGKDFAQPLCIQKVNVGSVAEKAGVVAGDAIVSIAGHDALSLRHKEAQDAIVKAGNSFQLVVQRGAMTWKPQVTPLQQAKKTVAGPVATKTSLAVPKTQAMYNTPINLYSEDNLSEALSAQSEVLGKGCMGINFRKFDREVKLRTDSPTYQLIHGQDSPPATNFKPHKELPVKEEQAVPKPVFPVPQPGQQGYYNINDKMYCDVHAKQAAKHAPPAPNMVPVTVKPGATPPAGALPASIIKPPAQPAPAFVPAPVPAGGSSANPTAFGAPSGGIDVRSHIPKKDPAPSFIAPKPAAAPAPAPSFIAPKPVVAPAPKPVAAPKSVAAPKPIAPPSFNAPKPAAAPMFGSLPKPVPPPGMGALTNPPGGVKGIAGQRSAPKRGRGIMNPAQASRIPVCGSCHIQIRGPFVTALGKNWCPDCFKCTTDCCRKPLIDIGFVEEQGQLYCEDCYEKFLAPTCGKCDKRIKGDCLNAVGKQFCPGCFTCAYCGMIFGSGAFYLEDGLPYCETHWNDLFTTKCVSCGFPIEAGDRWVEALNSNYHSQCFKCSKCHKNLEGQSFFAKGGKPFCKSQSCRSQRGL